MRSFSFDILNVILQKPCILCILEVFFNERTQGFHRVKFQTNWFNVWDVETFATSAVRIKHKNSVCIPYKFDASPSTREIAPLSISSEDKHLRRKNKSTELNKSLYNISFCALILKTSISTGNGSRSIQRARLACKISLIYRPDLKYDINQRTSK